MTTITRHKSAIKFANIIIYIAGSFGIQERLRPFFGLMTLKWRLWDIPGICRSLQFPVVASCGEIEGSHRDQILIKTQPWLGPKCDPIFNKILWSEIVQINQPALIQIWGECLFWHFLFLNRAAFTNVSPSIFCFVKPGRCIASFLGLTHFCVEDAWPHDHMWLIGYDAICLLILILSTLKGIKSCRSTSSFYVGHNDMEKAGWNMWIKHPKELLPFLLLATLHPEADAGGACLAFLPLHKHTAPSKEQAMRRKR